MVQLSDIILTEYASQASEIKGFGEEFRWLSNFFEIEPFEYQGIEYKTTENFYQSMKTFDREVRIHIAGLSPGKAKRFASPEKHNFVQREDWNDIKLLVMEYALREKFSQEKCKKLLLSTRNIYIEETNNWNDTFFGCTLDGKGENNLGKLIMQLRSELTSGINLTKNNMDTLTFKF